MINIILLTILIGLFIGSFIFLVTNFVCIPKCNKCGVSDGCGGTCSCKKGQTCDENNLCNDDIKESLSNLENTYNCTGESEQIMATGNCLRCCNNMIPYTDGACHTWPYKAPGIDIDYNPPSCVEPPPDGCTKDGDDMFVNSGVCLPCCAGSNSFLLTKNNCKNNAEYTYSCYSQETANKYMNRNLYRSDPVMCMPYKPIATKPPGISYQPEGGCSIL